MMLRRVMMAGAASGGDPYWSNVSALLNMGGADGSTSFPDSASIRVWTRGGSAQVDTSLGYNTALFDGDGDSITTPYLPSDFDWWPSDYTIEAWIYPVALSAWQFMSGSTSVPAMVGNASPTADVDYWSFGPLAGGAIRFIYYTGASQTVTSSATINEGALSHIALSKTSSGIFIAVNGVVESPVAIVGTPQSSGSYPLVLGRIGGRSIDGHVRGLRITKGVARYTSNFTPPTPPLPTS